MVLDYVNHLTDAHKTLHEPYATGVIIFNFLTNLFDGIDAILISFNVIERQIVIDLRGTFNCF